MKKTISITFQFFIFAVSICLIFFMGYVFGYNYFLGDSLPGNDAFSFYTVVDWFSKFYPSVPFWFPIEGGGISFTGYQWFAAYLINILSHTFSINNVQGFRLMGFLSIPLTAVG